jgi:hypothetical protein
MQPSKNQIFNKWLELVEHEILKKNYKQYLTKTTTEGLTEEGTIVDSELLLIAKLQVQEKTAEIESREPKFIISIDSINSKGPYHEFTHTIEFENWTGKPFVKLWKSIKPYNCPHCAGKGFNNCECESGAIQCKNCSGKAYETCSSCHGKGESLVKVSIIDGITNKKRNEELSYNCQNCYGEGTVVCNSCSGLGKVGHGACSHSGKLRCKNCKGVGKLVDVREEPVPIKVIIKEYIFTGYSANENEQIFQIIQNKKLNMDKIDIQKIDDLEMKDVEVLIPDGYANIKNIDKFVKDLNKECKNILKSRNEVILPPIMIYANQKLLCKTTKGVNFEILSIGDKNDFEIIAFGLKT